MEHVSLTLNMIFDIQYVALTLQTSREAKCGIFLILNLLQINL